LEKYLVVTFNLLSLIYQNQKTMTTSTFTMIQFKKSEMYNAEFGYQDYSNGRVFSYYIRQNGTGRIFGNYYSHDRAEVVKFAKENWNRLLEGENKLLGK
jgi:hypothetical protein